MPKDIDNRGILLGSFSMKSKADFHTVTTLWQTSISSLITRSAVQSHTNEHEPTCKPEAGRAVLSGTRLLPPKWMFRQYQHAHRTCYSSALGICIPWRSNVQQQILELTIYAEFVEHPDPVDVRFVHIRASLIDKTGVIKIVGLLCPGMCPWPQTMRHVILVRKTVILYKAS